jgi:hypothetical protein
MCLLSEKVSHRKLTNQDSSSVIDIAGVIDTSKVCFPVVVDTGKVCFASVIDTSQVCYASDIDIGEALKKGPSGTNLWQQQW